MLDLQDGIRGKLDVAATRRSEDDGGPLAAHVQVQRNAVNGRSGGDGAVEIEHHVGS